MQRREGEREGTTTNEQYHWQCCYAIFRYSLEVPEGREKKLVRSSLTASVPVSIVED